MSEIETRRTTDSVILEKIEGLKNLIDEKFETNEKGHLMLLSQTTKTNGRVSILEKIQNMIIGGLITLNIIIVPVLIWLVIEQFKK